MKILTDAGDVSIIQSNAVAQALVAEGAAIGR